MRYAVGRKILHLNALRVHLVVLIRPRPVQTGISFLADEQVREINLLELELDRLDEFLCDELGRFTA